MQVFQRSVEVNGRSVSLRGYIPDAAPHARFQTDRPAVIVLPGGAYRGTYGGEAEPIALQYLAMGACAFVLDYSVVPEVFPQALLEALTTVRFVRESAEAYGIDPQRITVCGFSAGGHLAASVGTMWKHACLNDYLEEDRRLYRPDKMILCYPVTTYKSHHGSYHNLAGGKEMLTEQTLALLSVENHVDEQTPPAYLWHNCDDAAVLAGETLLFAKKLLDHGVPVEMRIYASGGHGTCLGNYVTKSLELGEKKDCCGWVEDTMPFVFR